MEIVYSSVYGDRWRLRSDQFVPQAFLPLAGDPWRVNRTIPTRPTSTSSTRR
jgi:hypothetical protein